ncbi:hypothetical protein Ocin01_00179 [Orchesella cincta]|uniref:Uncharacterized protein n=1 Tax=Orchesella cincta TaxID=48709 RepID=A0A1D2NMM1_ORCCI|nr:hypothetical protein Ocin01_00179 [Orchesella cincta]
MCQKTIGIRLAIVTILGVAMMLLLIDVVKHNVDTAIAMTKPVPSDQSKADVENFYLCLLRWLNLAYVRKAESSTVVREQGIREKT